MNPIRTVAIIGAGYAGVLAANRLQASLTKAERIGVKIVMINPQAHFVDRIRLHQVAAGTADTATIPLENVLHADVTTIVGTVARIFPQRNGILVETTEGMAEMPYDVLIYALGSGAPPLIPGGTFAHSVGTHDGALAVRRAVRDLRQGGRIVIVGGGPTGVEVASEIAEAHPEANIRLLSAGQLLDSMPKSGRKYIRSKLAGLNVQVTENAPVVHVGADFVELEGGRKIRSDLTIWAGSFAVPALARESGLDVDVAERLFVTETLQHPEYPNIIGAGDSVNVQGHAGEHLRMGCAVAAPMGGHAAVTALAYLRAQPHTPLSVGFFIRCLSLGRRSGLIQHVGPDDVPKSFHLSGRAGAWVKERVCSGVISGIQKERTSPGSYWTIPAPGGSHAADASTRARTEVEDVR
jgi:NADH:ubiquinone reductase (H+-translocating)